MDEFAVQKVAVRGKLDVRKIKPKKARNLVKKCLKVNPDDRPRRLAEHEFFKNASKFPLFTPSVIAPKAKVREKILIRKSNDRFVQENLQEHVIRIPSEAYFDFLTKNLPIVAGSKDPAAGDAPLKPTKMAVAGKSLNLLAVLKNLMEK